MPNEISTTKIKFSATFILFCMVLSFIAVGIGVWFTIKIHNESQKIWEEKLKIENFSAKIMHLDEVLTMSARLGALTGDPFWEKRYKSFEPQLESILEETKELSSKLALKQFVEKTGEANDRLIAMEIKALSIAKEGKLDEAKFLLFSDEYEKQKEIYAEGMVTLLKKAALSVDMKVKANEKLVLWFSFIFGLLALASLLIALKLLDKYMKRSWQAERELRKSEADLRSILESAGEGIYGLDLNGNTTFANPAAETLLGYRLEEMANQTQHSLIHHSKVDGTKYPVKECPIYAALKDGKIHQIKDEVFWRKDGSSFPVEYISTPILEHGKIKGAVVSFKDISQRKVAEEELLLSKAEAEKASLAKTEFLSRMSHELRTPMNAILGFTQLLGMDTKKPLADYQKSNLDKVLSAGNHLLDLINEVLDLSRIESGTMHLSIDVIDIAPIINSIISMSKPLANKRGISLKYTKIPNGKIFVEADPLRIKQVALNLISNAIKYNKPNGSVTVSFENITPARIRVKVKDSGRGIPDEKKELLFKPFERLDSDAQGIEGTGIGLTISKQLIEMMSGAIGFESVLGEGSLFYFDIPASDKSSFQIKGDAEIAGTEAELPGNKKKKILYVEDIFTNKELVEQILKNKPHIHLLWASNALDGIQTAQREKPDLILMDIHLPDMDGLTAFQKLQTIDKTRNIPVIALTEDAMDADIKRALEMGFRSYITKPIEVTSFLKKIDQALN